MNKKCELLAPAGGMKQLIAAVENGADAVYMGGHLFNARINAGNFSEEEIKQAISYAHVRNVKTYITVNTLFRDEELEAGLEYAAMLYETGADALIIQDLGFGNIIKNALPDLPLHLSTQASIYNVRGIKKAAELGYERVVPARELSLEEIRQAVATGTDIEIFVHGAMCFCYSGQCQMSRIIGGRSGNRGECAQPCRLMYDIDGKEGFYLSPKDMCMIDRIGELIQSGVKSFKIEGRMKSAEYVAAVTSIYRKYIDMYYETGRADVSEDDKKALLQIFNRGGFTQGYLDGNPGKELLSGNIPKHQGIYIGRVLEKNGQIVRIKTNTEIKNGDGIEIRGQNITGNIVTYIKGAGRGKLDIGDFKGYINKGAEVYRTSSIDQLKALRKTFEEGKLFKKVPIYFEFTAEKGKPAILTAKEGNNKVVVLSDILCEEAINKPIDTGIVKKQLQKTGNTPFKLISADCYVDKDISIPVSVLNSMRRQALEKLQKIKEQGRDKKKVYMQKLDLSNDDYMQGIYIHDIKCLKKDSFKKILSELRGMTYIFLPIYSYMNNKDKIDKLICRVVNNEYCIIPYVTDISKGRLDEFIEKNIECICECVKETGIMIGNLCWVDEFVSRGIKVYGGYGINVYNEYTDALMKSIGIEKCTLSIEACEKGEGNLPLMITEHIMREQVLTDRKGECYKIIHSDTGDKSLILSQGKIDSEINHSIRYIKCIYL